MKDTDKDADAPLDRALGKLEGTALVVGGTIGTSIFVNPGPVAASAGSPVLTLATWAIAGLLAFIAALCLAELSAAIPRTGGTYAFLRRAFRTDLIAFFYAWMISFVYGPGAMAVVAIMSGNFAGPYIAEWLDLERIPVREIGVSLLATVCIVNVLGVRLGSFVQNFLTLGKVVLLASMTFVALLWLTPHLSAFADPSQQVAEQFQLSGLTAGLLLCVFSFSGAHFVTLVAGEVRTPASTIPFSIVTGFLIVTIIYLLFNVAILATLPFSTVTGSDRIAFDLMDAALGPAGASFATLAVLASAAGVLNAQAFGYPRVLYSLASDGYIASPLAAVSRRTRVPSVAITTCTACAAMYVFSGTYTEVLGYVAFVVQLFTTLMVASVIVLRLREPQLERPYRVWGYPWTPLAFIATSAVYLFALLATQLKTVIVGILVVIAGLPFYLARRASHRRGASGADSRSPTN